MIELLLAVAMVQESALRAETDFEHDAKTRGQWTAFRKWAADDALMFVPQPVNAQEWLKGRKDPPESVRWTPFVSYVSCDRSFAVNTGPWTRNAGTSHGAFTTVWRRQGAAWRWIYDAGEPLPERRIGNEMPQERVASCAGTPVALPEAPAPEGAKAGAGASPDGTLRWSWVVMPDGARTFRAFLWNGTAFEQVISDRVAGE